MRDRDAGCMLLIKGEGSMRRRQGRNRYLAGMEEANLWIILEVSSDLTAAKHQAATGSQPARLEMWKLLQRVDLRGSEVSEV